MAFDERNAIDSLWDNTVQRGNPGKVISELLHNRSAAAWFLASQGIKVDPVTFTVDAENLEAPFVSAPSYAPWKGKAPHSSNEDPKVWEEYSSAVKKAIEEYYDAKVADPETAKTLKEAVLEDYIDTDGTLFFGRTLRIERSEERLGNVEVDRGASEDAVRAALAGKEAAFKTWLEARILPLFAPPTLKVGGRKVPYTLDNIVEAMSGRVRGQESTMTYGEGQARAMVSKRFKDLEQMRRASGSIVDEGELNAAREKAKALMEQYRDAVVKEHNEATENDRDKRLPTWDALDASMKAVVRWAKNGLTTESMRSALAAEGLGRTFSKETLDLAVEAGKAWLRAPVPYFEAKPQRAVRLEEFAGAVIPKSASAGTRKILEDAGIPFKEYEKESQQEKAVDEFRRELADSGKEVLFQPAFHGSPHKFERFSTDRIGSGEGAQVYGWGLYFAGNKQVAKYYREALSRDAAPSMEDLRAYFKPGNIVPSYGGWDRVVGFREGPTPYLFEAAVEGVKPPPGVKTLDQMADAALTRPQDWLPEDEPRSLPPELAQWMPDVQPKGRVRTHRTIPSAENLKRFTGRTLGRLYTVDIPEDSEYLDWDKPLSEQPAKVREVLEKFLVDTGEPEAVSQFEAEGGKKKKDWTGQEFYRLVQEMFSEKMYTVDEDTGVMTLKDEPVSISGFEAPRIEDSQEVASRYLMHMGIPGLKYLDQGSRSKSPAWDVIRPDGTVHESKIPDEEAAKEVLEEVRARYGGGSLRRVKGSSNYVIFDDSRVETTSYEQPGEEDDARGRISFGKDRQFEIELLRKMDLSTLLHEGGHFFLEIFGDLASASTATPEMKRDYQEVLDWLGVKTRAEIKKSHHEKWAEGFEQYLREGKAPSPALRSAFQKFRAWLLWVYRKVRGLNVDLTPEVRVVMDRLIATDAEIAAAQEEQGYKPIDPKALKMTPEEAAQYEGGVQRAVDAAVGELSSKMVAGVLRAEDSWWTDEFEKEVDLARAELDAGNPVYAARSVLRNNTYPDGTVRQGEQLKLDMKTIVQQYGGKARLKKLGFLYSKEGGLTPDEAARQFGFASGDELLTAIETVEPLIITAERIANQRMEAKYGPRARAEDIAGEAMDALHNEQRSDLLMLELRKIATLTPSGRKASPIRVLREYAERTIAEERAGAVSPALYQRAAAKANKAAFKALGAKNYDEAFVEKQREILNNELYRAASKAQETLEQVQKHMARYDKKSIQATIGKAGGGYLQQIQDLRRRFEFSTITVEQIGQREALQAWVDKRESEGYQVVIPDEILNEAYTANYLELPMAELLGIFDAVRNIEHLASLKNRMLKQAEKQDLDEAVVAGVGSIVLNSKGPRKADIEPHLPLPTLLRGAESAFAGHRKYANFISQMDGWKDGGAMWDLFIRPLNEAGDREAVMREKATLQLSKLFDVFSSKDRAAMYTKRFIPGYGGSLSRMGTLAVALNVGNADSRIKLLDGYGWTEEQLEAILDTLDKRDWDFVQSVWDYVDTYWPESKAVSERATGLAPQKVQAEEVVTKFGTYAGGYYPLKYDYAQSAEASKNRAKGLAEEALKGAVIQATTRHGARIERKKGVKLPIKLDFSTLFEHVAEVIHDQTHYEFLLDSMRLLRDKRMRDSIVENYGVGTYDQIVSTLKDVARGDAAPLNKVEEYIGWIRSGASVAAMGWNITTAMLQPLGLTQSIVRIGFKWVAKGVGRWIGDASRMQNTVAWVHAKSDLMRLRAKTQMREINEIRNAVDSKSRVGVYADLVSESLSGGRVKISKAGESYFWLISRMQMVVDIPTWIGAYEKAMAEAEKPESPEAVAALEARAIKLADQAVLDSQGGGQLKDLSLVQRGGPLMKIWTTFYNYMNTTLNLTVASAGRTDFRKPADVGRFVVDMLLLYSVPAVLGFFIREVARGGGDDDKPLMKRLAADQAAYLLGTMVGFRELTGAMQGYWGYEGPAGARGFAAAAKLVKEVGQGEADEALWKASNQAAGIFFHYPAGQVQKTVDGFRAMMEGETSNPKALLFGPERR